MISPAIARPLCDFERDIPLNIIPRIAAGNVVSQLTHPRSGMSPISIKKAAIRLKTNPAILMELPPRITLRKYIMTVRVCQAVYILNAGSLHPCYSFPSFSGEKPREWFGESA